MGNKIVEGLSAITSSTKEVLPDILILQLRVVNAFIIENPDKSWVLVDSGLENSANFILKTAQKRFGKDTHPKAIILTHGHFDHVGSVIKLSQLWNVPVYAHQLEIPYITGKKDYPVADDTVDEGIVAKMSSSFPHTSIDLGHYAFALPADYSIPFMPEWKWVPTPGHAEGHISLFREKDRVLIVGDAFSTVKQESLMSVFTQKESISGPPKYLTINWKISENSVKFLQSLEPSIALPSHGQPMTGEQLKHHLDILVQDFQNIAVPEHGKFL